MKITFMYKVMGIPVPENGKSIIFWDDMWAGQVLQMDFPELYSFTMNKHITLHDVMAMEDLAALFQLPLSVEAYAQFQTLQAQLQQSHLTDQPDKWNYIWGSNIYTVVRAYKHMIGHRQIQPSFHWLWASKCHMKYKVFF